MDIITLIILAIVGGVMIATVAASGIYYSYRSKRDREKEKVAAKITSTPARRTARVEKESYVVYQDESLVDFDSVPVQPETRRPIRYAHKMPATFETFPILFSNGEISKLAQLL